MSGRAGAAMARLKSDRHRKFVEGLFLPGPARGHGRCIFAAQYAKLGRHDGTSHRKTLTALDTTLLARPDIQSAIREYAKGAIAGLAPEAISAVFAILQDKAHRDHGKVALSVLDRIDPVPKAPAVVIDQSTSVTMDAAGMIARIRELAGKHGLDADALMAGRQQLRDLRAMLAVPAAAEVFEEQS
jgi:hypothetical protein